MKVRTMKFITLGMLVSGIVFWHIATVTPPYRILSSKKITRSYDTVDESIPKTDSDRMAILETSNSKLKDELRENIKESEPGWGWMVGAITSFMMCIISATKLIQEYSTKDIKAKIDGNHTENLEDHAKIFESLKVVADMAVRKDITEALKFIARNHIHYNKSWLPDEMQILIDSQTQRLIELSEEIMTEHFDIEVLSVIDAKIEARNHEAWKQVAELFGCEFLVKYKDGQGRAVADFKKRLSDIAYSNVVNSKYDRYRASAEVFLHDIIGNTINEYKNFKP